MPSRFHHELLRSARLDLEMTQEEAAKALGVDVRTYRRYESGAVNSRPSGFMVRNAARRRFLAQVSAHFGVDERDLVLEEDPEEVLEEDREEDVESPENAVPDRPAGASDDPRWQPRWAHVLQRARHFVGREALLRQLREWAAEDRPRARVIAVVGPGGAGKSAVAERFARALGAGPRPGGVFVWCFFEQPRVETFLAAALAYFEGGAPGQGESLPGERLDRLEEALRRGPPHLLVLDGLEAVQSEGRDPGGPRGAFGELEDPLLRRFTRALVHGLGRSRALVTTRFPLAALAPWEGDGLRSHALAPLSSAEGGLLLRRWGVEAASEPALDALVASVGGHPLSLAVIGSYTAAYLDGDARRAAEIPLVEPALAEAAQDEPLARRLAALLGAYAAALPARERDLLARVSVFPRGVERHVLEDITSSAPAVAGALAGCSRVGLLSALRRLERLGLVFSGARASASASTSTSTSAGTSSQVYSAHPFVRRYFGDLLGDAAEELHGALIRRIERSLPAELQTLRGRADNRPRAPRLLDAIEDLLLHTLEQGRPRVAFGLYIHALGGFDWLGLTLGEMARGARIARVFSAEGAPESLDERLPLSHRQLLTYQWGLFSGALGDLALARRCYGAVVRSATDEDDFIWLVTSLRALAYTERLAGRLERALGHVRESMSVARATIGGRQGAMHVVRGLALEGAILQDQGEPGEARARFDRLAQLGDRPVARRGLWIAEHLLATGALDEAARATLENHARCASLGWGGHVAHCDAVLAEIALARASTLEDDPRDRAIAEAELRLASLETWTRRTGEVEQVLRARWIAGAVALARGDEARAEEASSRGLELAEACGFEPARARLLALRGRSA